MLITEIKPLPVLKDILTGAGVTEDVYIGDKATSGLPNAYIELFQNGRVNTKFSKMGMVQGNIIIAITVKLLSTGARNTKKEDIVLGKFDQLFAENKVVSSNGYSFMLQPDNIVYNGGVVYEGYSTKMINLTFKKIKL